MSRAAKLIIGLAFSIGCIGCGATATLYYLLHKSLPRYNATLTLNGLHSPVKIYYDDYAVPHIVAASEYDLFFAQGVAHARERLWQMDFQRRAAQGRLSEVLGEGALGFDKLFRTVGIRRIADSLWNSDALSPQTRAAMTAYADGVNAFLDLVKQGDATLPIEFDILQYDPDRWKPQDSMSIIRLMGWELNIAWHIDIAIADLTARLGYDKAVQLYPDYPASKPIIVPDSTPRLTSTPPGSAPSDLTAASLHALKRFRDLDQAYRAVSGTLGSHIGSNAWAVTKSKSSTGNALLANDPHLGFFAPPRWYEMQLICESAGINASGGSLAGVPSIVLGRNADIAWGLTNMMVDDCDFFVSTDSVEILQEVFEEIHVKGGRIEPLTVRYSKHGVVISDDVRAATHGVGSPVLQTYIISMKWTGALFSDEAATFLRLLNAKNWNDFRGALRPFGLPGQNFVYADRAGNIGYHAAARVPIRPDRQGFLLRDAAQPNQDWQGFVAFDSLPKVYNPPSDMIVTANNKIVSDAYPYFLSSLWEPPSRAERITELLNATDKFSAEAFEKMQTDVVSPHAREMTAFLLSALSNDTVPSHQRALTLLKNWDYEFSPSSIAATIYAQWFKQFLRNTIYDEMGEDVFQSYITLINAPTRVMYQLTCDSTVADVLRDTMMVKDIRYNRWFDDVRTTETIETRDDIIRKSFNEAIEILRANLGESEAAWPWRAVHRLTIRHLFGQKLSTSSESVLGAIFNLGPFETGGSSTTINNGEYFYRMTDSLGVSVVVADQTLGASLRRVVDMTTQNFRSVMPGGNSGAVRSPHYQDQLPLWLNGTLKDVVCDTSVFESRRFTLTTLMPK